MTIHRTTDCWQWQGDSRKYTKNGQPRRIFQHGLAFGESMTQEVVHQVSSSLSSHSVSISIFYPNNLMVPSATANVAALTGKARTKVGPMPFQNPAMPSRAQVWAKQSRMVRKRWDWPKPSLCILLLTTSKGYEAIHSASPAMPPYRAILGAEMDSRVYPWRLMSAFIRYSKVRNQIP